MTDFDPHIIDFLLSTLGLTTGLSFVAELFPRWHKLSKEKKEAVNRLAVTVVVFVCFLASQLWPAQFAVFARLAMVGLAGTATYMGQQAYHKIAKGKK